ncbi:MAG: hypothetical protein Q9169_008671, partial [Polycauliona sp. 2 TL-2023]
MRILREMAIDSRGGPFDYTLFSQRLKDEEFSRDQGGPLRLRLLLLESFLDTGLQRQQPLQTVSKGKSRTKPKGTATNHGEDIFASVPGQLTI